MRTLSKKVLFKYKKLLFIVILSPLLFIYVCVNIRKETVDFIDQLHNQNYKVIQLFTERFFFKQWGMNELDFKIFESCEDTAKRCYVFKSILKAYEKSDGVIVHVPNLWYMPSKTTYKRNPKQIWMFYTTESQHNSYCSSHYNIDELDDWFNITATYKLDSDIVIDYRPFKEWKYVKYDKNYKYYFEKNVLAGDRIGSDSSLVDVSHSTFNIGYFNFIHKRTRFAVWFVSHCETYSRREDYVKELSKYIPIDIYGICTHFENAQADPCQRSDSVCWNSLINSYKFYLAFENSLCDDYITEKFWKFYAPESMFDVHIVPVVKGAKEEQYGRSAKPISFINTDNFKTPKELADYLLFLNTSKNDYLSHFQWKIDLYKDLNRVIKQGDDENKDSKEVLFERKPDEVSLFCTMCSLLHNETYLNSNNNRKWTITEWFNPKLSCWDYDEYRRGVYWLLQTIGFCY